MMSFRGFRKVFGPHIAVHDLSLEIAPGEVVALLGPNGSGKTTSLKAAAGLIRPTAGGIWIGGAAGLASTPDTRKLLSFLPQRVAFPDNLTGREVLDFYRGIRGTAPQRVGEVLRFASLNGSASRLVGTYSGGMVQRLGLAVALLPDAPLLLLDEPTAALDPDGLSAFYALIDRHTHDGRTVLFTSHQLGDAERLADRFAVLVDGRLVGVLTQRELREKLAARGIMRISLTQCPADLLDRVRQTAPQASWVDGELCVPGPPSARPAVLESIRGAAVDMRGLVTEEGRLDTWYRELVGDQSCGDPVR